MNYQHLSQEERYTITTLLKTGLSYAAVTHETGRNKSTISRELARNRRPTGYYTAPVTHSYATARRKRTRRGSHFTKDQWRIVLNLIKLDYSPEQVSHTLKAFFNFSMSHETMCQYLLYDTKKGGTFFKHLRIVPKSR